MSTNKELATIFSRMALYFSMDDVAFKPQAYERAADALGALERDARDLYEKGGRAALEEIVGVGKSTAEKIEEYLVTGKIQEYEALRKKTPVDVEELVALEGVGPKAVRSLYKSLGVKTVADLEKAAKTGKVQKMPGFGKRKEQSILQAIAFAKKEKGRWRLGDAFPLAEALRKQLAQSPYAREVVLAGSLRRMRETIGDIDMLVASEKPEAAIEHFLSIAPHEKIWGKGKTKASVRTVQGFDVDVRVISPEVFGAALQYFTGSKAHNVRLRTLAASKGYKLSEYGLFKGKKLVASRTEEDVYKELGLSYIEPELREDQGEIDAAFAGKLPDSIPYGSLKGDLQVQTDWTDGKHSIEEMAKEANRQGLEYIVITDHTRDLAMTGGMDEKKILRQMKEIDRINAKLKNAKFTILKGAEVNIRKDGTLDIADDVLAKLDMVGISVHSHFAMTKKDMTERIAKAMSNPHVDILFHPTGRLILKREAYQVDMEEIMREARKTGTVLEINAHPERLDLKDTYVKKAKEMGCMFAIDSDAHHKDDFQLLKYGVAQARRGWAEREDVVNTYPLKKMLGFLKDNTKAT